MGKIIMDTFISGISLLLLSPFFALTAVFVRRDGGPAFFRQKRVERRGKIFYLIKFRTMIPDAEKYGGQITAGHDPRITRIGHFLYRKYVSEQNIWLNLRIILTTILKIAGLNFHLILPELRKWG